MEKFNLKDNLLINEIESLEMSLETDINGNQYDINDGGWLHDKNSVDIIKKHIENMKNDLTNSKDIILDVLNNSEKYPQNVKDFFLNNLELTIYNLTPGNNILYYNNISSKEYSKSLTDATFLNKVYEDMLLEYFNLNNYVYKEHNKKIVDDIEKNKNLSTLVKSILNEQGIKALQLSNGKYGEVIEKYIENNLSSCIKLGTQENNELDKRLKDKEDRLEEERVKIHNKDDYNKLSIFANKLDKVALNELQNILIQCEYDKNVLSDFTSAVDDMVVNKNLEGNQLHNGTYMIYDTKLGDFYDISIIDKNDTLQLSFEKFINFIEEHKDNNLVMIQAREPSFKKFEKWEESIINNLFNVAKANNVHLMDFLVVNVDGIRKNGMGEYNFKGLINKNCYSYKYNTLPNVKLHINKLEVNETLKQNQGLYANNEIKTETNNMKAPK